jgi:hypothetical protein
MKTTGTYIFRPVGLDSWEHRPHQPKPGARVIKTQPFGCPKNGTMGHCFVADAVTGEFYGLVLVNSLIPERRFNKATHIYNRPGRPVTA